MGKVLHIPQREHGYLSESVNSGTSGERKQSQIGEAESCQVNSVVDLKKKGGRLELVQRYIFPLFHAFIHGTWDLAAHEMAETQREQSLMQNQGGYPGLQAPGLQDKQTQTYFEFRPRSV